MYSSMNAPYDLQTTVLYRRNSKIKERKTFIFTLADMLLEVCSRELYFGVGILHTFYDLYQ